MATNQQVDYAKDYCEKVLSGDIVAGKWARLACKRHLEDLDSGIERGLFYDLNAANAIVVFYENLIPITKGTLSGQMIKLLDWQRFILCSIFGWKHKSTGTRRFKNSYVEVAKKNGKSTFAAPLPIYFTLFDGETGSDNFFAAAKGLKQADICFSECKEMIKNSPILNEEFNIYNYSIAHKKSRSFIKPLVSKGDKLDGLNPHCAVIDEVHEHTDETIIEALDTGAISRLQALMFEITTAGYNRSTICWSHHQYSRNVLEGVYEKQDTDHWFCMIYSLDPTDDWTDAKVWAKANPSLNHTLPLDNLLKAYNQTKGQPSKVNSFKRYHLNMWTDSFEQWIEIEKWNANKKDFKAEDLEGETCYGGLDLANTRDFTAYTLVFPQEDDTHKTISFYWLPEEIAEERIRKNVGVQTWINQDWIRLTEGNVMDDVQISNDIKTINQRYNVVSVGYDTYKAHSGLIQALLEDGINFVGQSQSITSLSESKKFMEKEIMRGDFHHDGNPVTGWMISNAHIFRDQNENIKADKKKSSEKIDGVYSTANAIKIMQDPENQPINYEVFHV